MFFYQRDHVHNSLRDSHTPRINDGTTCHSWRPKNRSRKLRSQAVLGPQPQKKITPLDWLKNSHLWIFLRWLLISIRYILEKCRTLTTKGIVGKNDFYGNFHGFMIGKKVPFWLRRFECISLVTCDVNTVSSSCSSPDWTQNGFLSSAFDIIS